MMYYLIRLSFRQRLKEVTSKEYVSDFIVSEKLTRRIEQIEMHMGNIERKENARIEQAEKRGRAKGQRDLIKTLAQTMSIEDMAKALQRPIEEIKEILR